MIETAASIIIRLRPVSGTGSGRTFELWQDRVNVGRDPSNVVCLDHTTISLYHAILVRSGDHYKVRDLISTNGTYINGERTAGAELHSGDVLRCGDVEMRYEEVRPPVAEPKGVPSQTALPLGRQPTRARQYKIVGADGRIYGPADAQVVREWISQGLANAQTWVPAEGQGNWKRLADFTEFAEVLAKNTRSTRLLGTPPEEARCDEPVKVGPGTDIDEELIPDTGKQYLIVGADGRTYGPADAALVRMWISQGFANAHTWVPAEARGNWKQLGEFPEFADALVGITTPGNLLGTPPRDSLWEETVKVGPSTEPERIVTLEQGPVVEADRQEATRTSFPIFVGAILLLALAGAIAAWWFDQWPFDPRGPLRQYARNIEGYIYSDPDYAAAATAEDAKDYAALLQNARQLVSHYPNSSLAHYILGVAYGKLGSYSDATVAFQQAIKLKPDYIDAWNNLGWACSQSGRFAEAVGAFQQLIKLTPNDPQIWSNLGGAQAGQGHEADAIAAYQMAIQLKPDYADAHFNLGAAYANRGKLVDAVSSFRLAVKYKPDFPEAWFNLGVVSSRQGENNEAVGFFQKAINQRPNYAEAWGGLVKAHLTLHQTDKANEAARELKRLNPAKADQLAKELGREAPPPHAP